MTAVHPGLTRTEATPAVVAGPGRRPRARTPAEIERRMARLSLHPARWVDASEVAAVITFLASPLSVAINGEAIGCGGGTPGVIRY